MSCTHSCLQYLKPSFLPELPFQVFEADIILLNLKVAVCSRRGEQQIMDPEQAQLLGSFPTLSAGGISHRGLFDLFVTLFVLCRLFLFLQM